METERWIGSGTFTRGFAHLLAKLTVPGLFMRSIESQHVSRVDREQGGVRLRWCRWCTDRAEKERGREGGLQGGKLGFNFIGLNREGEGQWWLSQWIPWPFMADGFGAQWGERKGKRDRVPM